MEKNQMRNHVHGGQPVVTAGQPLSDARAALVLVHGRGATAQSILPLGAEIAPVNATWLAPQAAGNTWYPYSFLSPMAQNEPGLSSALATLATLVEQIADAGIPADRIVLGGFSQGACLASEFVARNAQRYGGLLVFSGGLIGPPGTPRNYPGDLAGTPVFIGCSDVDFHIPVARVHETTAALTALGAEVTERIYPGMDHIIVPDEITAARKLVAGLIADRA